MDKTCKNWTISANTTQYQRVEQLLNMRSNFNSIVQWILMQNNQNTMTKLRDYQHPE